jgi:hypothetical protein
MKINWQRVRSWTEIAIGCAALIYLATLGLGHYEHPKLVPVPHATAVPYSAGEHEKVISQPLARVVAKKQIRKKSTLEAAKVHKPVKHHPKKQKAPQHVPGNNHHQSPGHQTAAPAHHGGYNPGLQNGFG